MRISKIVEEVQSRIAKGAVTNAGLFVAAHVAPSNVERGASAGSPVPAQAGFEAGADYAEWTLPIKIPVSLGGSPQTVPIAQPQPASAAGRPAAPTPGQPAKPTAADNLARKLIEDTSGRTYYDEAQDHADRDRYYAAFNREGSPRQVFAALSVLLQTTHAGKPKYNVARLRHLYPWVDLHEDNQGGHLVSIYSGKHVDAHEVLR